MASSPLQKSRQNVFFPLPILPRFTFIESSAVFFIYHASTFMAELSPLIRHGKRLMLFYFRNIIDGNRVDKGSL